MAAIESAGIEPAAIQHVVFGNAMQTSGDAIYGAWRDITDVPPAVIARLKHYFLTYKRGPDDPAGACEIHEVYGADTARTVLEASQADYQARFPDIHSLLNAALRG